MQACQFLVKDSDKPLVVQCLQISSPCFTNLTTAPEMSTSRLLIPRLSLASREGIYKIGLVAAKSTGNRTALGARSDTDATTIRVLATAGPTGKIT